MKITPNYINLKKIQRLQRNSKITKIQHLQTITKINKKLIQTLNLIPRSYMVERQCCRSEISGQNCSTIRLI